jgi:hypothetical protein
MRSSFWRLSRLLFCLAATLFVASTVYFSRRIYAQCVRLTVRSSSKCPAAVASNTCGKLGACNPTFQNSCKHDPVFGEGLTTVGAGALTWASTTKHAHACGKAQTIQMGNCRLTYSYVTTLDHHIIRMPVCLPSHTVNIKCSKVFKVKLKGYQTAGTCPPRG